jgi:hypothetical protein
MLTRRKPVPLKCLNDYTNIEWTISIVFRVQKAVNTSSVSMPIVMGVLGLPRFHIDAGINRTVFRETAF